LINDSVENAGDYTEQGEHDQQRFIADGYVYIQAGFVTSVFTVTRQDNRERIISAL